MESSWSAGGPGSSVAGVLIRCRDKYRGEKEMRQRQEGCGYKPRNIQDGWQTSEDRRETRKSFSIRDSDRDQHNTFYFSQQKFSHIYF